MNKPIITVKNVTKTANSRQLLTDINFSVVAGSLVSIIGPNGAGKSTLMNIILGIDTDYTGSVSVSSNERIQYIPQLTTDDQYQLPISVAEYLLIGSCWLFSGLRQQPNFVNALDHVGLSADILQQSFHELSGGERQRVAIARALLTDPTVLVLDEPLAAVDYASRKGLYELIRHLQQDHNITVLLVSHDVDSVLPLSDQVLCLNTHLHTDCHPTTFNRDGSPLDIHHHC